MSSKTKKKPTSAAALADTPPPAKKFKMPKNFIVRPLELELVRLHPDVLQNLDISSGGLVLVTKEAGAQVVATAEIGPENYEVNVAFLPALLRLAGAILLGDRVVVEKGTKQPPYATLIEIKTEKGDPKRPSREDIVAALLNVGIVHVGTRLMVAGSKVRVVDASNMAAEMGNLSLEGNSTVSTLVSPAWICSPQTEVVFTEHDVDTRKYPRLAATASFASVGGLDSAVALLRSTVETPLHRPTLFSDFGISPPRGVLLHGPPGTGKTMLLRCVAHECDAHVITVSGPSIVSKYLGETETVLRDMFAEAERYEPAIIFMDELDSLAPRRDGDGSSEVELRVVATLLTMMDGLGSGGRVVVVGATNRPNSIDPALRRPGRFDQEVEIGIPDVAARTDILRKQLQRMNAEKCALTENDISEVAAKTHGYVGADIVALCRESVMRAISRGSEGKLGENLDPSTQVTRPDFELAMKDVRPSAMREIFLEMPRVCWSDIAGQEELKRKLTEVVQLPLEAAETFKNLGVSAPKGVLLYGPPGCSKTLTAKALATESGLNFLAVKGPEIFNKYVGESERTIREIFRKARAAAPSIIFFDEIDALASSRDDASTQSAQNVLTSLLNEIDGVEELNGVVIVAATNRPSEIDPALLRPGRLDRHVYVAPPDHEARLQILTSKCMNFKVDDAGEIFESLASATDGCSGAEVALLCQEAGLAAIMEDKTATVVKRRHFDHALRGISKGITPDMLAYFREFASRLGLEI